MLRSTFQRVACTQNLPACRTTFWGTITSIPYNLAICLTNVPRNPPSMKMRLTCPSSGWWASFFHQARALVPSWALAGSTCVASVTPSVSMSRNRRRPLINLPPSKPMPSVAVAEFLTLCESRMRVVGSAFFFRQRDIFRGNQLPDSCLYFPTCRRLPTW